jgi:hypothetical protein
MDESTTHIMIGILVVGFALWLAAVATLLYILSNAVDSFTKICDAASAWLYADAIAKEKKQKPTSTRENP